MKQHYLSLTAYNIWANSIFVKMVSTLSAQQTNTIIAGSFDSIRKTVLHIYMAEYVWNQRLGMAEKIILPENYLDTDCQQALEMLLVQSNQLHEFVKKQYNDDVFTHEVVYKDMKNTSYKNTVGKMLTHVCNHSTFHRGQLVNFMRTLGVKKIDTTDYIHYCRVIEK
jgi:uncharacterized damage-inducible protein DinB